MKLIAKPTSGIPSFYQSYIDLVPDDQFLLQHLQQQVEKTRILIKDLTETQLLFRYASDKWTIKEILVHLSDCERIIIYRTMRIARGDSTLLPGFDESAYAINAQANERTIDDILDELLAYRNSSISFIRTLKDDWLDRTGTANGYTISARLLVNHLFGHHQHHLNIITQKYLPSK